MSICLKNAFLVLTSIFVLCGGFHVATADAQGCPELVGRWPYGPAQAVAISGDYAYFGSGTVLQIVDVSDPMSPQFIGEVVLPGLVNGIEVSGGYAYVANIGDGLRVIDVSTPTTPVEVGYYDTPGHARNVAVSGSYAYVADYDYGLRVIDISTPSAPVEVGFVDTPGFATGVAVSGDYAFVADYDYGLRVIDVSTQTAPVEVGFVETSSVLGVAVAGNYAYVADYTVGLRVIDVSTPTAPIEVGFVETSWPVGLAVAGDYAYVADLYDGLRVIDVSTATAPVDVGFVDTPDRAYGVAVAGNYAYVAGNSAGLRVIDVSTPTAPVEVGFVDTPGIAKGVAVAGNYAYVAGAGLRVIDVSTPSAPVEVSFVDTPGFASGVAVSGDFAFVADGFDGLRVIDVSTATAPVEVGFVDTPGMAEAVAVSGDYAYVADSDYGLRVIDVSTAAAPEEVGFVDTPGMAEDVAVAGNYAYVADLSGGLRVIDVSTPSAPVEVGSADTPGYTFGVAVSGAHVYVAEASAGLEIFRGCHVPPCTPIYIAAAAAYPNNTPPWASDLGITNNGDEVLTYKFQFLPRDADNTDVAFTEDMTLATNTSVSYVDIWNTFAGKGAGAINVCVSDADGASVTSRIYTTTGDGTVGQSFVGKMGVAPAKLINTGETARLGFLAQNSAFRTNIGFMNAGPVEVTINAEFFSADGTSLGADDIDLLPYSNFQWNEAFVNKVGANNVAPGAFVDVWSDTIDASFLTYASVIDKDSDDPTTIWPFDNSQMVGGSGLNCTPIWIAAAASFPNNTPPWASDVGITNLGAEDLSYKFQFLPRGNDNSGVAFSDSFTLGGNQAVAYSDIWNELAGGQGAGAINVCVDNGANAGIVSRIYSIGENGTYGQSFDGKRGGAPAKIATGEKVRLAYLFENDAFRTNIGFMNAGANEFTVNVEFFDMQGASLGTNDVTLPPYSNTQWNRPYAKEPIWRNDITAGFVEVWTNTPDANFLTYASVVDNGTDDPTTIWPF